MGMGRTMELIWMVDQSLMFAPEKRQSAFWMERI